MKKFRFIVSLGLVGLTTTWLSAMYEQEQMQVESQLQARIEGILSKTLPSNSYLVTVKAEMENRERPSVKSTTAKRGGSNSLLGQNQYVLPGVPEKKEYVMTPESTSETTVSAFSAETLVKRILITVLVAPDVSAEQIRNIREVITGSVPFNPLRGDEMDIQNSPLLKPASPAASTSGGGKFSVQANNGTIMGSLSDRANAPVLMLAGALIVAFILFVAFLFGPMRAFLDRLLTVLPRVGEQAAYTVSNAPTKAAAGGPATHGGYSYGMNGNGSHNPEEGTRPFHFIRDDQLNKLPILFRGMSPSQCALVLAYLPAEWASKVLAELEQGVQNAVMRELSQAREVPPNVVKELEDFVKMKLPYLVGGTDWIQSVYQHTQPQTQRALLGTLSQQAPELAQARRKKTFFIEDLTVISTSALRMVIQEAGYSTAALALRDEKPDVRTGLLNRLPVAMREILQQELDLSANDKTAMMDAKMNLMNIGRRLLAEGRISLPEKG